ncbi:MAG TPA: transcription termination/antitermination protein NusG [Planctomycetota bacterium]|nr:transcription termination/antitermination protein NusG [Planctomycetota bacterium]
MAMNWYVLRVQTAREDQVKEALEKRVKANGLEHLISNVVVPTEKVKEIKRGSTTVRERKIYPGYVMAEMELGDEALAILSETPGVGGVLGTGNTPVPMTAKDVEKMLMAAERTEEEPTTEISFSIGDRVRIKEGLFQNFDGEIEEIWPDKGQVRVIVSILGRPTPVELEYWQLESI